MVGVVTDGRSFPANGALGPAKRIDPWRPFRWTCAAPCGPGPTPIGRLQAFEYSASCRCGVRGQLMATLRQDSADSDSGHDVGASMIPMFVARGTAYVYDFHRNEVPGALPCGTSATSGTWARWMTSKTRTWIWCRCIPRSTSTRSGRSCRLRRQCGDTRAATIDDSGPSAIFGASAAADLGLVGRRTPSRW